MFEGQRYRIFLINGKALQKGYHAKDRNAAKFFHHLHPRLEKAKIAPKLIYQNALYQATLLRTKQGQRAVDTGKDSSSVNIGHQKDISSGMGGHGKIDQVGITQIDFGNTSCSFKHHGVVTCRKSIVGSTNFPPQLIAPLFTEIVISIQIAHRSPIKYNLRRMIGLRLEQQRIHICLARHTCRLGLHHLRTPHLQSVGRDVRIKRHILCLEGSGAITILPEDAAKSRSQDTLTHIAPRTYQHHRM